MLRSIFIAVVFVVVSVTAFADNITGTVNVQKDDDKVTSVTVTTGKGKTLMVVPSGKGAALASTADGERVKIKGSVKVKKNKKTKSKHLILKVSSFNIILEGVVNVEKDGKKIKAVTVGGKEIAMDGKGKELAKKYEGKEVFCLCLKKHKDKYLLSSIKVKRQKNTEDKDKDEQ